MGFELFLISMLIFVPAILFGVSVVFDRLSR